MTITSVHATQNREQQWLKCVKVSPLLKISSVLWWIRWKTQKLDRITKRNKHGQAPTNTLLLIKNRPKAVFSTVLPTSHYLHGNYFRETRSPTLFRKPSVLLRMKGICHMLFMMVGASAYYRQENKGGILRWEWSNNKLTPVPFSVRECVSFWSNEHNTNMRKPHSKLLQP